MTREEYFEDVESIAQDIVDRMLEEAKPDFYEVQDDFLDFNDFFKGEFVYGYDYNEDLHEAVDGSSWIIWTNRHNFVVQNTNNIDAWTELGELPKGDPILGIAFWAMMADVRDKINELVEAM